MNRRMTSRNRLAALFVVGGLAACGSPSNPDPQASPRRRGRLRQGKAVRPRPILDRRRHPR